MSSAKLVVGWVLGGGEGRYSMHTAVFLFVCWPSCSIGVS